MLTSSESESESQYEIDVQHPYIKINYNEHMEELETILLSVKRPGNFYIRSAIEIPMPKIEVDGFGVLSFPVTSFQVKQLIEQAIRSPFGRSEETVYDLSVRKVWQLPSEKIRISGSSWSTHFGEILSQVRDGLGCLDVPFSAELYKMLIYDEGSLFRALHNTKKTENMFGTLVVVLPSMHKGGELIICHAGKKVTVDLSNSSVSELTFAAFYAGCQHKVLPILEGNRLCLIYSLIQKFDSKSRQEKLVAPMCSDEIKKATKVLESSLNRENSPTKIAYLLEHRYSSAALSFAMLKNEDATLAKFLCHVAYKAKCAIHLAIIHISQFWGPSYSDDRQSEESSEQSQDDEDFEMVDVCKTVHYANGWVNVDNKVVDFGNIPVKEGEILPNGALDGQPPQKYRCTEATGNEGTMSTRFYRHAALVIWRIDSYPKVLLQAGVDRVLPYLKDFIEKSNAKASGDFGEIIGLVNLILDEWEKKERYTDDRSQMLSILTELNQIPVLERFLLRVIVPQYDGTENASLVSAIKIMDPDVASTMLCSIVTANMNKHARCCVKLLSLVVNCSGAATLKWKNALENIATAVITGLKNVRQYSTWNYRNSSLESSSLVKLWNTLLQLEDNLQEAAAEEIISYPSKFDPKKLLIPVLSKLYEMHKEVMHSNESFILLWNHTSQFLLSRNEHPPKMPKDLKQQVTLSCNCVDCTKLQKFLVDPHVPETRFRQGQDSLLWQHFINIMETHKLALTLQSNSRNLLVSKSLYAEYKQQLKKYRDDVSAMKLLISLVPEELQLTAELRGKLCLHL